MEGPQARVMDTAGVRIRISPVLPGMQARDGVDQAGQPVGSGASPGFGRMAPIPRRFGESQ